jgi:hypothetical protein
MNMKTNREQLVVLPKHGDEQFHASNDELGFSIKDFWIWSSSDLMNNVTRGHLAEFIVAKAIGTAEGVRNEWATYDLTTPTGIKVEVKSAAYPRSEVSITLNSLKTLSGGAVDYSHLSDKVIGCHKP